jgi:hypothetical protein
MSDDLTRSIPSLLDTLRERHMSQVSEEVMNRYVKRTYQRPLMPVHFLITATGIENFGFVPFQDSTLAAYGDGWGDT